MLKVAGKTQILEDAGYAYSFDRLSYVNREARKVFSIDYVQDHSETEIKLPSSSPRYTANGSSISTLPPPKQ
jgi:hypothetical protein